MQHLLFHHLGEDALVMTSANVPGEPMVLNDNDALELKVEYYLLHDREIINRCDDTVVRTYGNGRSICVREGERHLRAWMFDSKGTGMSLGTQENLCGAVATNGQLLVTQYIGDVGFAQGDRLPQRLELLISRTAPGRGEHRCD